MSARRLPEAAYHTLKAAVRRLVGVAGGLESAASITRVSHSSLGFYGTATHDSHMPIDVLADIEADIKEPVVTRELARLSGYRLVPEDEAASNAAGLDPAIMALRIARELGEFAKSVEDMDEDGKREPHEVVRCLKEIDDIIDQAHKCRGHLYELLLALQKAGH